MEKFLNFDRVEAFYWFCVDYHRGQFSKEYRLMCKLSRIFTPSRLSNGPSSEEALDIYVSLCEKYATTRFELINGENVKFAGN